MSWVIEYTNGIHLPQIGWWLDAHKRADRSFVSHAHFDHLSRHGEIICTEATGRLMHARMPAKRKEHRLAYGQTERLTEESSITLYPAGHVLGAAQAFIAHERHGTLLYTGDFKLEPSRSCEPCATPRADVLIMETTFGRSAYRFPHYDVIRRQILEFCENTLAEGATPVLLAYSLGKAQELLALFLDSGFEVMLAGQAFPLSQIYVSLGVKLAPFEEFQASKLRRHVVICPPHQTRNATLARIPRPRTAMVTGWALDTGAKYRYRCDTAFALSDHSDYDGLLEFVGRVQPKRVYTMHGFAEDFARTLRERGVDAWPLGKGTQLELGPMLPGLS